MATAPALFLVSLLFSSQSYAIPKSSTAFGNTTSASSASILVVTATTGRHDAVTYHASRVNDTSLWNLASPSTAVTTISGTSSTQVIYPSGFEWALPSSSPSGPLPAIPSNAPYAYVSNWNPSSLTSLSATGSSPAQSTSTQSGRQSSGGNGTNMPTSATSASSFPVPSLNKTWPGPWQPHFSGTGSPGTSLPWPLPSNGTVSPGTGSPFSTPLPPGGSNSTSAAGSAVTSLSAGMSSIISSIISANSTTESGRNSTKTRRPTSTTSSGQTTTSSGETTTSSGQTTASSGSSGSSTGTSGSSITNNPTSTPTKPWGVETTTLSGSTWTLTFESTTATAATSFVESDSSTTSTVQVKSGDPIWSVPTPPAGFPLPVIPPPLIPPPVAPVPGVPPPCVFGCGGGGGGSNPSSGTGPSPSSPSSTESSTDSSSSSSSSTESCSSSSAVSSCMVTVSLSTSFLSGGTSSSTVATNTTTSCTTVTACTPTTATTTVSTSASGSGNYCSPGCAQCEAPVQTGAARRSSGAEELLRRDVPDSRTTFNVEAIYRKIESRISSGQTINLKHGLTGILSTGSKIDFGDAPKNLMVSGLVGCTSIAVVSRKGAWLSHIYESPTFLGSQAQFQQQALDPLQNGGKDFESLAGLTGGDGIFADLSQTKVFIMTPGNGGSPLYGDFVAQLRGALTGSGGPLNGASVAQHVYAKPSGSPDDDDTPLPSDFDGKALIMYDNDQVNEPNQPKGSNPVPLPKPQAIWQVYMEDQRMDQDLWDPASGQACSANQKRQDGGSCTSAPSPSETTSPAAPVPTTNSTAVGSAVGTAISSLLSDASSIASAQSASASSASAASSASSAASAASAALGSVASAVSSAASAAAAASSSAAAPLPPDCILFDTGLSYAVQVYGVTWDNDKGDALHKQEKGCGALTSWSFDADCQGGGGIAWFELPYFIKSGCVERAIHSSGGPGGLKCGQGGDVDNVPNAAAPCFLSQPKPQVDAKVMLAVGQPGGSNVSLPDPQPWPISKSVAGPLTTTHELAAQTAAPQRRMERPF